MANEIKLSPADLRDRAAQFDTEGKNLHDIILAMDGLKGSLLAGWAGDAANGFAERYDKLRPGFISAEELIEDVSKALTATANQMEEQDSTIGSQWRG